MAWRLRCIGRADMILNQREMKIELSHETKEKQIMTHIRKGNRSLVVLRKLCAVAGVGAMMAAPMLATSTSAEAQRNDQLRGRPGQIERRPGRDVQRRGYETFTGQVTNIISNQRFDLRVGRTVYNVTASSSISRRLQEGDQVRVYGLRSGTNDIKNANVSYIGGKSPGRVPDRRPDRRPDHNRGDRDPWGSQTQGNYRTYVGQVTNIESSQRFDISVGNIIYNVKPSSPVPSQLKKGDEVQVYGLRSGTNDIINANVRLLRGWDGRGNQGNWGQQGYQTFTGRVTDIESNQRFDIMVGSTLYNVKPSSPISRRLNRGDMVRVYGLRSGTNDIINANVVIVGGR